MEARTSGRPGGEGGPARIIAKLLESAQDARFTSKYEIAVNNNTEGGWMVIDRVLGKLAKEHNHFRDKSTS